MHVQPSLGRAEAYINVHLSHTGPGVHGRPPGPFVTLSREAGSGGSTLACALAARLDREMPGETAWTVFDRNLVELMLQSRHLSPRIARFLPEDRISEIDASIGELLGLHPSIWSLIQRTNDMMRELARCGHVILVGRGGNFATAGIPNGLHLRLVAPEEHRARMMAPELGMTEDAALAHNSRTDTARRAYVRSVFQADVTAPSAYDLLINMATVPLAQAVDLVADVLRARRQPAAAPREPEPVLTVPA